MNAAVHLTTSIFDALHDRRIFIVASKADKVPRDPTTLHPIDAQAESACMLPAAACAHAERLGEAYGVGVVLAPNSGLACIDVDGAWDGAKWSDLALSLANAFGSAYIESSVSGRGLHIIFSYQGAFPAHRSKNTDLHVELYHELRYILLTGHTITPNGSVFADYSSLVPVLIAQYFQPKAELSSGGEWTTEPVAMWHGPADDDSLIKIALRSKKALNTKATFKDLWTANADRLAKVFPAQTGGKDYDASSADLSLANSLAFWTGNNCERMETLMRASGLARDKWQRDEYLRGTILNACESTRNWYNDGKGIVAGAAAPETSTTGGICLDDFHAYLPQHNYIFAPNREIWGATGVDASVPWPSDILPPSKWLDRARPVHQMTWVPGREMVIKDRLVANGGWIEKTGSNTFNLYLPPAIVPGDAAQAKPWLDLISFAYPEHVEHIVKWFAHRRQRPHEKVNHALVFGGEFGVGKDSMIEPLKYAIGPWNFGEIAPKHLQGEFNGYYKSVVLRVSEARDTGEVNRYALYETTKTLIATPPDVLRCNEKNLREHDVFNVMGVIFTTNHKDGLYLPAGDRRHYVMWSERVQSDFPEAYWPGLWRWYQGGGFNHVVAYLDSVDLSDFDPKATPNKTPAFFAMVDAGRAPEDSELADVLDKLGNPPAVTLQMIAANAEPEFRGVIADRRNRRQMPHRFDAAGYVVVRNLSAKDGEWKIGGKRQTVYARKELSERDRLAAASGLR